MSRHRAHIVLVHGGWHGSWCWDPAIAALADVGVEADAVQLPSDEVGAGAEAYADVIAAAVRPGRSVIVGHSLAGLAIPLVPARVPVAGLVFLASLLPLPGSAWREQLSADRPMADWFYDHALPRQGKDAQKRSTWPSAVAKELFFHDCTPDVAAAAAARLRPQAPTPVAEKTPVTAYPDVPMHYVIGSQDRAVSVAWAQRVVPERVGVEPRIIEGSHSPFLADPAALAALLGEFLVSEVI